MPKQRLSLETACVAALTLAFMWFLAVYDVYEGDDINSVVPLLHLPEAVRGELLIYRYNWQPLSYWTGYALWSVTGSIGAIFALAQVGMALGIALIYRTVRGHLGFAPLLFIPLVLLFPELIYTGLYFNSSALGFPFAAFAVLLCFEDRTSRGAVLSGAALGIAVLMRMDYVLIAPAIAVFRLYYTRAAHDFALMALSGFVVLGLGMVTGVLQIPQVLETYQIARDEIIAKADAGGWNDRAKLFVSTTVLSPAGWLCVVLTGLWILRHPKSWGVVLIGLICLAPLLFAARNILTPKYMIPAYALMPVLAALLWQKAQPGRWWTGGWLTLTIVLLVVSIEPRPRAPFVTVTAVAPYQIGTHDGPRSWGAYLVQWARAKTPLPQHLQADALTQYLLTRPTGPPIAFVGGQNYFDAGGLVWRLVQLRLEKAGHRGRLVGPDQIAFDLPGGRVLLAQNPPSETALCVIVLKDAGADVPALIEQTCG